MGLITSLQVCMDSSNWLQGSTHKESGDMDSSPPSGDHMLTYSRYSMEKRLRPPHDQALKCPRCDSTHTKFCYYNNYSLTQPRYFCKTCRRYWTKGGTLRNIPVGGGCRKNKKGATKKLSNNHQLPINQNPYGSSSTHNQTDLQLSFPNVQYSHLYNYLENNYNAMLEISSTSIRPIDFMENKFEGIVGNSRNYDYMGNNGDLGLVGGISNMGGVCGLESSFHGVCSTYGMSLKGNSRNCNVDTCQRLVLPDEANQDQNAIDVKPNLKLLSLDWQDQGCSDAGKDSFGYHNGLGSWNGVMNNYGPSTTNPLV